MASRSGSDPDLTRLPALPVTALLPQLAAAVAAPGTVVITAEPGAGKSTLVPLHLLGLPQLAGQRVILLEPRRLAARALAARMAALLNEEPGETVGYRIRQETRVGRRTRLEVVTEGVLTRLLQADAALDGVGALIFDEFHERNVNADLALALALDARANLRPDLALIVMSATIDAEPVARLLGGATVLSAPGRAFPVTTTWLALRADEPLERSVVVGVRQALADTPGDVLVFLPGAREIERAAAALQGLPTGTTVRTLYGDLSRDAQDAAIRPAPPGERKVLLATNIAETSLTIEGITAVVDSGLERRSRFDPATGLSRLETGWISQASADQRRGRAGRLGPGRCYRLWGEARQRSLRPATPPEITTTDLASVALELAAWGHPDGAGLAWLDAPPAAALGQARDLLRNLGALATDGVLTPHGQELQRLGVHPRIGQLLLAGRERRAGPTAAALGALLTERDLLRGPAARDDADIRTRLDLLRQGDHGTGAVRRGAEDLLRRLGGAGSRSGRGKDGDPGVGKGGGSLALDPGMAGELLATAWPERVGRAREPGSGRFQLASGRGAVLATHQILSNAEFIVAPAVDAGDRDARILLAAPVSLDTLREVCGTAIRVADEVAWDARTEAVVASRREILGAVALSERPWRDPDPAAVTAALLAGIASLGLASLPWTPELRQWQARVLLLRAHDNRAPNPWPDVSDAALLATLADWLAPWLEGCSRRDHLRRLDLPAALRARLDHGQQRRLDELAPTHLAVPSGSRIAIDYLDGEVPTLSVRLQEVFGLRASPALAGGRVPVLVKLLSPAGRPVQVTRDLASFWATGYHEVRRELKGRYPRHHWPEDPHTAEPTRRVRPR